MATRKRTAVFLQYRNAYFERMGYPPPNANRSGFRGVGRNRGEEEEPFWVKLVTETEKNMTTIAQQLSVLEKLLKQPQGFVEDVILHNQIRQVSYEIEELIKACNQNIKIIGNPPSGKYETQAEAKTRENAKISLATVLQNLTFTFHKKESGYAEQLGKIKSRNKESNDANLLLDMEDDDDLDVGFNDTQLLILDRAEKTAASRERELNEITKSIQDLAVIFRDLHQMVIVQGTVLDRIDANMENVVVRTADAHGQLVQANEYQKKYSKKLIILGLIVVVVVLILFLLVAKK